jgi:LysR family hydrogen peroxide-inducible transcriptional activator
LVTDKLFHDEFKLAVSTNHPLAIKKYINPNELIGETLLLLDEGHCLRDQALQFCQLNGAAEEQNVRGTSLETLRQMVIADTGITFIPNTAIQQSAKGIAYVPFEAPQPERIIYLVWRKTNPRTQLMAKLKQTIINMSNTFT